MTHFQIACMFQVYPQNASESVNIWLDNCHMSSYKQNLKEYLEAVFFLPCSVINKEVDVCMHL